MTDDSGHDPTTKKTFSQKWGDDPFTSMGYTQVPNALIQYAARLQLRSEECWLICCVLKFKFDDSNPTPRQEDLADLFGQSVDTVQRTAKKIVAKNLLRIEHVRGERGRFTHMVYDFTPLRHALNECYYTNHPQERPCIPAPPLSTRPQKRGVVGKNHAAELRHGDEEQPCRNSAAWSIPQNCGMVINNDTRADSKTLLNQESKDSSRAPAQPDISASLSSAAALLVEKLIAHDVNRADALRLAKDKPEECARQMEYLPYVTEFRSGKGAYLRSAIEGGYGAPKGYREAQKDVQKAHKRARIQQSRTEAASQTQTRIEAAREAAQADKTTWEQIVAAAQERMPKIIRERPQHPMYAPTLQAHIDAVVAERAGLQQQDEATTPAK